MLWGKHLVLPLVSQGWLWPEISKTYSHQGHSLPGPPRPGHLEHRWVKWGASEKAIPADQSLSTHSTKQFYHRPRKCETGAYRSKKGKVCVMLLWRIGNFSMKWNILFQWATKMCLCEHPGPSCLCQQHLWLQCIVSKKPSPYFVLSRNISFSKCQLWQFPLDNVRELSMPFSTMTEIGHHEIRQWAERKHSEERWSKPRWTVRI